MELRSSHFTLILVLFVTIILKCDGEFTNCILDHEDTYYDLTPIASEDHVLYEDDMQYKDWDVNYYFSFCHPLKNVPRICSDPNASVCIETVSKNKTTSGTPVSRKIVVENGGQAKPASLTIDSTTGLLYYKFTDGSKCTYNDKKMETQVVFMCAKTDEEESRGPVVMSRLACEKKFMWATKHACPKKREAPVFTPCTLKFKDSNDTLNLKHLHSKSYYNISSATTKLQMNICGNVKSDLCKGLDASVCDVTNPHDVKLISTTKNMELERRGGLYSLLYNFNTTLDRYSTTKYVKIDFICERNAHDIEFNVMDESDTSIHIAAITSAVCTPKELQCTFKDRNRKSYDLRQLHKPDGNYEVHDNREEHRVSNIFQYLSIYFHNQNKLNWKYISKLI